MIDEDLLVKITKTLEESNRKTIEEANKLQTVEIKQHINKELSEVNEKFEQELNRRTSEIENKYKELKLKYSKLEKDLKKNNIIIFGLESSSQNLGDVVVRTLNQYLGLNLLTSDIDNVYTIGKQANKKPIIVKWLSYLKKQDILKNGKKLKGTNISVSEELTSEEIEESKILRRHLKEARSNKLNAFIKHKKLFINGEEYSAQKLAENERDTEATEEILETEQIKNTVLNNSKDSPYRLSNSAPQTPTHSVQQQEDLTREENKEEVFETEKVEDSRKKKIVKVSQPGNKIVRSTRINSNKEQKIPNITKTPNKK